MAEKLIKEDLKITDEGKLYEVNYSHLKEGASCNFTLKKIYPNSYKFRTLKEAEKYVTCNCFKRKSKYPSWVIHTLSKYGKINKYFKQRVNCTEKEYIKNIQTALSFNLGELRQQHQLLYNWILNNGLLYELYDENTKKKKNNIDMKKITNNKVFLSYSKSEQTIENAIKLSKECHKIKDLQKKI